MSNKYKKQTILALIVIIFLIINSLISFFLIPELSSYPLTNIIPGDHMIAEISMIFLLLTVFSLLSVLIIGQFLGILILRIHKKALGKNLEYGLQELKRPDVFKLSIVGLIPALLTINIAMILSNNDSIVNLVLTTAALTEFEVQADTIGPILWTFLAILPYASIISIGIIIPIWALIETGVTYSSKKQGADGAKPVEVRTVGGWLYSLIKGYTGIGTVVTYYIFIMRFITESKPNAGLPSAIIILPLFPFVIFIFFIPAFVLNNILRNRGHKTLMKVAAKLEIPAELKNPFSRADN
jgi:hypothetical protein